MQARQGAALLTLELGAGRDQLLEQCWLLCSDPVDRPSGKGRPAQLPHPLGAIAVTLLPQPPRQRVTRPDELLWGHGVQASDLLADVDVHGGSFHPAALDRLDPPGATSKPAGTAPLWLREAVAVGVWAEQRQRPPAVTTMVKTGV